LQERLVKMERILRQRSALKAITYRILMTVILAIISYIYTGDFFQTSAITIVFTIIAIIVYYLHERVWARIKWGKER